MTWLIQSLRHYPEIALFLAVGAGFWIGNLKFGNFTLGTVTASLLIGLVIGNLDIHPSRDLRWGFFMLFLFANGYSVGPQFFQALKSDGIKPLSLSLVTSVVGLVTAYIAARLLNLDPGLAGGLFSGGMTQSSAIGTASDAITGLAISEEQQRLFTSHVVVADALCYVFGAYGVISFCGVIAPWLLRIDPKAEAAALEQKLGIKTQAPGVFSANFNLTLRTHRLEKTSDLVGQTVWDAEIREPWKDVFIIRIGRHGKAIDATPDTVLERGDHLVLYGHTDALAPYAARVGREIVDGTLLDFSIERLNVVVTNRRFDQLSIAEIRNLPEGRGVTVRSLTRGGQDIPLGELTDIHAGDNLELIGPQSAVERAAKFLGYPLRPSTATPLSILGFGIFAGALIGLPAVTLGNLYLTLTTSVGVLLAGLLSGWLRSVRPLLPVIPDASLQVMITLGLAVFVACAGMQAGPLFLDAASTLGPSLFLAGAMVTMTPLLITLLFGRFILKMNPILLIGAISGAQTYTGGLAAIQEKSGSRVAVLGYTVPYATSNILLTMFGAVIVALVASH